MKKETDQKKIARKNQQSYPFLHIITFDLKIDERFSSSKTFANPATFYTNNCYECCVQTWQTLRIPRLRYLGFRRTGSTLQTPAAIYCQHRLGSKSPSAVPTSCSGPAVAISPAREFVRQLCVLFRPQQCPRAAIYVFVIASLE